MQILLMLALLGNLRVALDVNRPLSFPEGKHGTKVLSEGMPIPAEGGAPMLPMDAITLALPQGERAVSLKILSAKYEEVPFKGVVSPVPDPQPTIPPEIKPVRPSEPVPSATIYSKDDFYPDSAVELTSSGHLLGWPVAGIKINPFRYNPVRGKLQRLTSVEFEVLTEPDTGWTPRKFSPITAFYARQFFDAVLHNPEQVRIDVVDDVPMEYLIVVPSDFEVYADSIALLHRELGIKTAVRTMEWVSASYDGRDDAEKLRNYLKAVVDSGVLFVAIAGDEGYMPVRVAYAMTSSHGMPGEDSIRADLYFSDLDGTWNADNDGTFGEVEDMVDMYPDIFIGRIPAWTRYGMSLYYHKLKRYLAPDSSGYLKRVVLNGMILWQEPFSPGGVAKEFVDSAAVPDSLDVRKLYEYLGTSGYDTAAAELRRGEAIYNHNGHGWYYAMWVANGQRIHRGELDNLGNPHNYGFLYTTGCWVGAFDYYSFGEVFTILENTPGIGFIGNSRYGWGSPGNPGYGYSDIFDTEFFKKLYKDSLTIASMTLAAAKIRFIPLSQWRNVYRWHEYEINLLGDPVLHIHRGSMDRAEIVAPERVVPGQMVSVQAIFSNGRPVRNAIVAFSHDGNLIARGLTGYDGVAAVQLPDTILYETLTLTVSGESILPYRGSVDVVHSDTMPMVIVKGVTALADDGFPPESGENFRLAIRLKNVGGAEAGDVEVAVSLDTTVELYQRNASFRNVAPGTELLAVFHGKLKADLTGMESVTGKAFVVVDGDSSVYPIGFTPGFFALDVIDHTVFAGNDSIVESNEDVRIAIMMLNSGTLPLRSARFELIPIDDGHINGIRMVVDSVYAEPGDTFELMFDFRTGDVTSIGGLNFELKMSDRMGHSWEYPFMLVTGIIGSSEGFEDGAPGWQFKGHWSITSADAHSGVKSAYCGIPGTGYLPNWDDSLISPWLELPPSPQLSFWLKFETANYGVDGIFVYVYQDTSYMLDFIGSGGALDSTLNIHLGWAKYSYDLSFLDEDRPVRVLFVFRSDNDALVGEGFFIDDVVIGGSLVNAHVPPYKAFTAYPTPAKDVAKVRFELPRTGHVSATVFDIAGRFVREFDIGFLDRGTHFYQLNLSDYRPGVYFLFVKIDGEVVGKVRLVVD